VDTEKLRLALADQVESEVRFDAGTRGAYAHDGSNYRQPPLGVVVPRNPDAAVAAVAVCAEFGAPVLSRGGGTSLAGQCCNAAVVIDWTKFCHQVVSVDPGGRMAVVQPGIALDKPSCWPSSPRTGSYLGLAPSGASMTRATRIVMSSRSSSCEKAVTRPWTVLVVSAADRPASPASSSARLSSK
jgi:hypothetical protein